MHVRHTVQQPFEYNRSQSSKMAYGLGDFVLQICLKYF